MKLSVAASLVALLACPPTHASDCLRYPPAEATIRGKLVRRTYPGPPNYTSIAEGDRAETSWFVELPVPQCVSRGSGELEPEVSALSSVQLVLSPEQYRQHESLVGQLIEVRGELLGSHTGTTTLLFFSKHALFGSSSRREGTPNSC